MIYETYPRRVVTDPKTRTAHQHDPTNVIRHAPQAQLIRRECDKANSGGVETCQKRQHNGREGIGEGANPGSEACHPGRAWKTAPRVNTRVSRKETYTYDQNKNATSPQIIPPLTVAILNAN